MKKVLQTLGWLCSIVYPPKAALVARVAAAHFYTGYKKRCFAHWGKGSVIAYKALRLEGLHHVSIGNRVQISKNVQITAWTSRHGCCFSPEIIIGEDCVLREGTHITAVNSIRIGNNLLTGNNVLITDNSHGTTTYSQMETAPEFRDICSKGPVIIGNNVWLGNNVCIMPGVTIGDGAVIGANSVVTHDIPPFSVAAGIPTKVIKQN